MQSKVESFGAGKKQGSISRQKLIGNTLVYILLICGAIVFMIPFAWMISTSLKEPAQIFVFPPKWIPEPICWNNYLKALTIMPFQRFLLNTVIITASCLIGQVLSASLVAYGFARIEFPGREFMFILLISTMLLPGQVTMIPIFILFKNLNWIDTFKPLILPAFFGGGAYFIFFLRQFFKTIPFDLEDAARIDGCSTFGIFAKIILPLAKPALTTVAIFSFMNHWNDFMGPLIYINSLERKTIALGLASFQGQYTTDWHLLMAASVVALIPVLVIFFSLQKYFVEGIALSGIKG